MKARGTKLRKNKTLQCIFCKVAKAGSVAEWQRARLNSTSSISVR